MDFLVPGGNMSETLMVRVSRRAISDGKMLDMFPIAIRKAVTTGRRALATGMRGHAEDSRRIPRRQKGVCVKLSIPV